MDGLGTPAAAAEAAPPVAAAPARAAEALAVAAATPTVITVYVTCRFGRRFGGYFHVRGCDAQDGPGDPVRACR